MTLRQALALIRQHGIVLEAARGTAPSLAAIIAGEPIRGSWWSHPKGRQIFAVTRAVRASDDVLVCRLAGGRITFVHRRLWPALVRAADRLPPHHLSRLREIHTRSGHHVTEEVPFPGWVPPDVRTAADALSEEAAVGEFAAWIAEDATARAAIDRRPRGRGRRPSPARPRRRLRTDRDVDRSRRRR